MRRILTIAILTISIVITGCNNSSEQKQPKVSKKTESTKPKENKKPKEAKQITDPNAIETYEQASTYMQNVNKVKKSDELTKASFNSTKIQVGDMIFDTGATMTFSEVDNMLKAAGYKVKSSEAHKIIFDDYEDDKFNEFQTKVIYKNEDAKAGGIMFEFYCNRAFPDPDESSHYVEDYMPEADDLMVEVGPYASDGYWESDVRPYDFPDVDHTKAVIYQPHGITYYNLYSKDELIKLAEGDGGHLVKEDAGEPGITYLVFEHDGKDPASIYINYNTTITDSNDFKYDCKYCYLFEEIADTGKFGFITKGTTVKSVNATKYEAEHNM